MKEKEPIGGKGSVWDVGTVNIFIFFFREKRSKQASSTDTMLSRAAARGALRACSRQLQRRSVLQCRNFSAAFTEDELMIKDMVARFSADVIKPRVRAMDDAGCMDPAVITGLFENGLMGVEVPAEQGGSGLGFTSACLVIEEIAKVDPSVAVMVDIQVRSTEHVCAVTALEAVTLHLHCYAWLQTEHTAEQHAEVLWHTRAAVEVLCTDDKLKSSIICTERAREWQ